MEPKPQRKKRRYELGVWHPLALPAGRQNRAGYESLDVAKYPSNIERKRRQEAIDAVRAFHDEVTGLLGCHASVSGPLHHRLRLDRPPGGAIYVASAVEGAAQRHGLVCYDPQTDTLTLPLSPAFGEAEIPAAASELATPVEQPVLVTFGPWTIRGYVEATKACYKRVEKGGSDACECDNCTNFALARERAYPPEVLAALDSLGIDRRKESEVHYYGKMPAGLHTYRGWFYFVGVVEDGPKCWHELTDKQWERHFHRIGPGFEVGLGSKTAFGFAEWETVLIDAGFADGPCGEIDFYADLPWISDAPEPHRK